MNDDCDVKEIQKLIKEMKSAVEELEFKVR